MADLHDPAIGYVNVGRSYEASALRLPVERADKSSYLPDHPRRQLLVMAIELYLKAYLISQGMTEEEIRKKFSHKLGAIAEHCRSLGFHISHDGLDLLILIEDCQTFSLDRYFTGGTRTVPKTEALQDLAGVLFKSVGQIVADKRGKKFDGRGVSPINK